MKKHLLPCILLALICVPVHHLNAQTDNASSGGDYSDAIGLRLGGPTGLTYQHFMNNDLFNMGFDNGQPALEVLAFFLPYGIGGTLLYEYHFGFDAENMDGFRWYAGGGIHAQAYGVSTFSSSIWGYRNYRSGMGIGIDAIIGMEFKIPDAPVVLSVDVKPSPEITTWGAFFIGIDPAISIRYCFGQP